MTVSGTVGQEVYSCISDINEERLKFLASVTKGSTVHVQGETPEDTAERVKKELGGFADVTLECSAAPTSIAVSFYVCIRHFERLEKLFLKKLKGFALALGSVTNSKGLR